MLSHVVLSLTCLTVWMTTGLIFGWPSLVLILKEDNVFWDVAACGPLPNTGLGGTASDNSSASLRSSSSATSSAGEASCKAQDEAFSSLFALASSVFFFAWFAVGFVVDRAGARATTFGSILFAVAAAVVVGLDTDGSLLFLAAICWGLAAPGTYISSFSVRNLFPNWTATVTSAVVGSFIAAALVFRLLALLVIEAGLGRRLVFLAVLAPATLGLGLGSLLYYPRMRFRIGHPLVRRRLVMIVQDAHGVAVGAVGGSHGWSEDGADVPASWMAAPSSAPSWTEEPMSSLSDTASSGSGRTGGTGGTKDEGGGTGSSVEVVDGRPDRPYQRLSFSGQIRTLPFLMSALFFLVSVMKILFFLGILNGYMDSLGDTDGSVVSNFGLIFALGCLGSPFVGPLIDRLGVAVSLAVSNTVGVAYAVVTLIENKHAQTLSFVLISAYRPLVFSTVYAYLARVFGLETYGRLTGVIALGPAILGLIQIPVVRAITSYAPMNWAMLVAGLPLYLVPIYVHLTRHQTGLVARSPAASGASSRSSNRSLSVSSTSSLASSA